MRKLNKQDFIFIGTMLLFAIVTFVIYFIIRLYFVDTCVLPHEAGYIGYALNVRHTKMCFGEGGLFDKYSQYFYILFLWIIIVSFIRKKYQFSGTKLLVVGIIILMGITGTVISMLTLLYSL